MPPLAELIERYRKHRAGVVLGHSSLHGINMGTGAMDDDLLLHEASGVIAEALDEAQTSLRKLLTSLVPTTA